MKNRTGLILSGGMDSTSIAWWVKPDVAFTVDYGQLAAKAEQTASGEICRILNIEHHLINVNCKSLGSGDMAGNVANNNAPASDWWPYRNQLLITLVAMKAISLKVNRLLIGTVKNDSFHQDGTIEFLDSISNLLSLQEGGLIVDAPAINLSTLELIKESKIPIELLKFSHSCHKSVVPCNNCRGCNKHNETLHLMGLY